MRALPPQFLLPAWSVRQLHQVVRRFPSSKGRNMPPFKAQTSLFDQLFPEESEKKKNVEQKEDKLPPFKWNTGPLFGVREPELPPTIDPRPHSYNQEPIHAGHNLRKHRADKTQRLHASVLVLNCASKTLEESDFYRVSPKGEHIEGWTSGIIQVIQGRDSNTLEPLGHYFILFTSDAAAYAYLDQMQKLHRLARAHSSPRSLGLSALPPLPGLLRKGEDLNEVVKTFSLVPGNGRLSLRMVKRPLRPSLERVIEDGGAKIMTSLQKQGDGMVLFSLDVGQLDRLELKFAIEEDGRRRNLLWKLVEDGIEPLYSEVEEQDVEEMIEGDRRERPEDTRKSTYRRPARHILVFEDRNEARRFVRGWHRRPLPVKREPTAGEEPPPIVNAQILW